MQGSPYGMREDGTPKGRGWLGELPMADGKVMTELSIGVSFDGKEKIIPSIVPTLSQEEIKHLSSGGDVTDSIVRKAVEHAKKRIAENKSVWADDDYRTLMGDRPLPYVLHSETADMAPGERPLPYVMHSEAEGKATRVPLKDLISQFDTEQAQAASLKRAEQVLASGTVSTTPRQKSTLEAWGSGLKGLYDETLAPMRRVVEW